MAARIALALVAASPAAVSHAGPPAGPEGLYVADIRETATALELTADGRFRWFLTVGALDLTGDGRWRLADDGSVRLTSDPPYVPPSIELVGIGRDGRPGLLVRLDEESRQFASILDIEAELADGGRVRDHLDDGGHRLSPPPGRRLVAIRFVSDPFDFRSEPFPAEATDGRVMTFRFVPGQLGRADFRDQRVAVEADALNLTWRGMTLRYARTDPQGEDGPAPAHAAPEQELPTWAELERALVEWMVCGLAACDTPWRQAELGSFHCAPVEEDATTDAPPRLLCGFSGRFLSEQGAGRSLDIDCAYLWRPSGHWTVQAIPDADVCEAPAER